MTNIHTPELEKAFKAAGARRERVSATDERVHAVVKDKLQEAKEGTAKPSIRNRIGDKVGNVSLKQAALAGAAAGALLVPAADKGYVSDTVDFAVDKGRGAAEFAGDVADSTVGEAMRRISSDDVFNPEHGNPDNTEEIMSGSPVAVQEMSNALGGRSDLGENGRADENAMAGSTTTTTANPTENGSLSDGKGNYTYPTTEDAGMNYTVQQGDSPVGVANKLTEQGTEQHAHMVNEVTLEAGPDGLQPGDAMHIGDTPVPVRPPSNPGE